MQVRGKKVVVVGLGRTAVSLVKLLLREGAFPYVTDHGDPSKLRSYCAAVGALDVPFECGGHSEDAFSGADLVIPSPGVAPTIPVIARARTLGADAVSEMEFAYGCCRSRILAVTGTNGKTTTTELLRALVASCGHSVVLAGNNALPFSEAVQMDPAPEYIVLEVSSYQLELARRFRPWIGAVLNVTPDHLARHGTVDAYAAVKQQLFANQKPGDTAVINYDDPLVRPMTAGVGATLWPFSLETSLDTGLWLDGETIREGKDPIADVGDILLPGRHNIQNVLAALSVMRAGRFDWTAVLSALRTFKGVEHRIEHVAAIRGVDYYNDSKSTNIDSLKVALESFSRPVVLIAGGQGKGADYCVLRDLVREHVKRLVTLGQDAPLLEQAFGDLVATERADDMTDAVARAAAAAAPGEAVLLSPACASFDMYANFEHRGKVFKECVQRFRATTGGAYET